MTFKSAFFNELTVSELYEIVRSRIDVFLMEQRIICQDFDGVDYDSLHCFLWQEDRVVAYLRAFRTDDGAIHIGRVLSLTHGVGLGRELMERSFEAIREKLGQGDFILHAQTQAEGFYEKLGFTPISDIYLEEGIPHVTMVKKG